MMKDGKRCIMICLLSLIVFFVPELNTFDKNQIRKLQFEYARQQFANVKQGFVEKPPDD